MLNKLNDLDVYYKLLQKYRFHYLIYCIVWIVFLAIFSGAYKSNILELFGLYLFSWLLALLGLFVFRDKESVKDHVEFALPMLILSELMMRIYSIICLINNDDI
jgi:hypothetical protein